MATFPDYTFGLQGVLLVANGVYTLLYPKRAAGPSSPISGTPVSVVHAIRLVPFVVCAVFYTLTNYSI